VFVPDPHIASAAIKLYSAAIAAASAITFAAASAITFSAAAAAMAATAVPFALNLHLKEYLSRDRTAHGSPSTTALIAP